MTSALDGIMQPRRNRLTALLAGVGLLAAPSVLLTACVGQIADSPDLGGSASDLAPANGTTRDLGLKTNGSMAIPPPEAASGYLLYRGSSVDPWCGAVLVDPLTVLTAAHCVEDASPDFFTVGFGALGSGTTYHVGKIVLHPDYRISTPAMEDIAVLTLHQPVNDVRPAVLSLRAGEPQQVTLVSYAFVLSHQRGDRNIFAGQVDRADDSELSAVFTGAETNCHGEGGAGLFHRVADHETDELLGIGSSGSYDSPHPISPACVGRLLFASIAHNRDFLVGKVRAEIDPVK